HARQALDHPVEELHAFPQPADLGLLLLLRRGRAGPGDEPGHAHAGRWPAAGVHAASSVSALAAAAAPLRMRLLRQLERMNSRAGSVIRTLIIAPSSSNRSGVSDSAMPMSCANSARAAWSSIPGAVLGTKMVGSSKAMTSWKVL